MATDRPSIAVGGYLVPDDSVRVNKAPDYYDRVLAANPQITLHTVQVAAEAIAGPICERHRVAGARWDASKDKFVFSKGSDAKVIKDRWAGGLRSALARRAADTSGGVDRLAAVEAAVKLAQRNGHHRAAVLEAVERGFAAR
ncbi:hypothetical protein [Nocardioides sp. P5_E3]